MRSTLDFTPYRRSLIGFNHLFDLMANATLDQVEGYPPFDVAQEGEDRYRISLAVAGFKRDELDVKTSPNLLVVSGRKQEQQNGQTHVHRGITACTFERQFQLADHVFVTGASLVDGILEINLKRELPDAVKPRKIEIQESRSDRGLLSDKSSHSSVD